MKKPVRFDYGGKRGSVFAQKGPVSAQRPLAEKAPRKKQMAQKTVRSVTSRKTIPAQRPLAEKTLRKKQTALKTVRSVVIRKTIPAQRPLAEKAPRKKQTARKTTRRVQTVGKKTALKAVAQKRVARKAPRKTQVQKIKYTKARLDDRLKQDLLKIATRRDIVGRHSMTKDKLVDAILKGQRGINPACPPNKYTCKRTGPLETPARTDRVGCRYCKLHPKRK